MVEHLAFVDLGKRFSLFSNPGDETRGHFVLLERVAVPLASISDQSKYNKCKLINVCNAVTLERQLSVCDKD